MSSKLRIDTRVRSLKAYLDDFEKTTFQIPSFQRDFLWSQDDIRELFDSIKNSYPIGSILLWSPVENHSEWICQDDQYIGPYRLKNSGGHEPNYILDGFQRLSTLFGCLTNPTKHNSDNLEFDLDKWKEKFNLHYDLEEEQFLFPRQNSTGQPHQVPVYVFMNSIDFRQYARKHFEQIQDERRIELYYDRADEMGQIFNNYQLASVDIKNATIEEAVEIFRRVNEKGMLISKDWIVSALTNKGGFRLGSEIDNLLADLKKYNFDNIKRDVIFQCVQNAFGKYYYDVKIEDLVKRDDFVPQTKRTLHGIKSAIEFLFKELNVINSKLLPYSGQLIILSYYFTVNDYRTLSDKARRDLMLWFWTTSYSNYFTVNTMKTLREAFEKFMDYSHGRADSPLYIDDNKNPYTTQPFPNKVFMGSVRAKTFVLFMLHHYMSYQSNELNQDSDKYFDIGYLSLDGNNTCENFIPIVLSNIEGSSREQSVIMQNRKAKDLSSLMEFPSESLFIDESTKKMFDNNNVDGALAHRKTLIKNSERTFVKPLGIIYDND